MEFESKIVINKPIEQVIALFDNFENMPYWQPDLVSYEHLSGDVGQVGAKTKLLYKMGKRECELIETIIERDLPRSFSGTYDTKGIFNRVDNQFEKLTDNQTEWRSQSSFEFTNLPMKIMSFFMKKSFAKQSMIFMENFKAFAEKQ